MQELNPVDRYQLRKAQMDTDKTRLDAQRSEQELQRVILELENKYDLIAEGETVDPITATIQGQPGNRRGNGKGSGEAFALVTAGEQGK
jgi:hypothetical protein